MLTIDGSVGEGGGQILRTSLALSLCSQRPCRIAHIRTRRPQPGLRPQHLAAVRAAASVGRAELIGGALGSQEISFAPHGIAAGEHQFDIGTAGSTGLVLQTVLPALVTAPESSRLVLTGGTHNPNAPPFDFLALAFLPLLERMGARVRPQLERYGFYPRGGGRIIVDIDPAPRLQPLCLEQRGAVSRLRAEAVVASLPEHIADRELETLGERLGIGPEALKVKNLSSAAGPGNAVMVVAESESVTEVFTGFGMRGVSAERVAGKLSDEVERYLAAGVPVGEHLADQLLLPLVLGGGAFVTLAPSTHARSSLAVLEAFTGCQFGVHELAPDRWRIAVG